MNWFSIGWFAVGFVMMTAFFLIMRRRFRQKLLKPLPTHRTLKDVLAEILDGPNHN